MSPASIGNIKRLYFISGTASHSARSFQSVAPFRRQGIHYAVRRFHPETTDEPGGTTVGRGDTALQKEAAVATTVVLLFGDSSLSLHQLRLSLPACHFAKEKMGRRLQLYLGHAQLAMKVGVEQETVYTTL